MVDGLRARQHGDRGDVLTNPVGSKGYSLETSCLVARERESSCRWITIPTRVATTT
jgi:hypothetical protein